MEVLDARPDPRGGYRVDVGRSERIGRVSSGWFSRRLTSATYPSRRFLSARVSAFFDQIKAAFLTGSPDELAAYVEA